MNFSIKIKTDKEGFTGRECPKCEKYFKIKFGTGLPGDVPCHCPYCNHIESHNSFWTKDQLHYAESVAMNKITVDLLKELKKSEIKPNRNAFISIEVKVEGSPSKIIYYSEKDLEQKVECDNCKLLYSIYGVFGYCPDCGIHNSYQILKSNFELIKRMLLLSENEENLVRAKLLENALEDVVSAFDGFGRELCSLKSEIVSFQNISNARIKIQNKFNYDLASSLSDDNWSFIVLLFEKRHLIAHKFGIIDEEFIKKTGASKDLLRRKVSISSDEVIKFIHLIGTIAQ